MKRFISLILVLAMLIMTGCSKNNAQWQEQYELGNQHLSHGNYEEAISAFTATFEFEPENSDVYVLRGDAHLLWAQQLHNDGSAEPSEIEALLHKAEADYMKAKELSMELDGTITPKMDQIIQLLAVESEPEYKTFFEKYNVDTFIPESYVGTNYIALDETGGIFTATDAEGYPIDINIFEFTVPLTTEKCYGDIESPLLIEKRTLDMDIKIAQTALTEQETIETMAHYEFKSRDAVEEYGLIEDNTSSYYEKYGAALDEYLSKYPEMRSGYKVTNFVIGFDTGTATEALKVADDFVTMSWAIRIGVVDKYTGTAFMVPFNETYSYTICVDGDSYDIDVITAGWEYFYDSITGETITTADTLDYGMYYYGSLTVISPVAYDGLTFFLCPAKTEDPIAESTCSLDFSDVDLANSYFFNYEDIHMYSPL